MREALPSAPEDTRALAAEVVGTTQSEVGKRFSERPRSPEQIAAQAGAMADMVCASLDELRRRSE